jgi:transcription antitermination factor NusG
VPILKREPDITPGLFDLDPAAHPWRVAHVRSRQEKSLARHCVERGIPFYLPLTAHEVVTRPAADSARRPAASDTPTSKPQSAIQNPHSELRAPHSELRNPQSTIDNPQSAIRNPQSAIQNPQSAIRNPQSARVRVSHTPLFPGYVFLRAAAAQRVDALRSNVIVSLLEVTDQGSLAGELGQIHALQQAGAILVPFPWLAVGDAVRIRDGAFRGWRGVIVKEKGAERLVVSVSMIMRSVLVELGRENVVPGAA